MPYYFTYYISRMENINITQLKADLDALFTRYTGKKYDNTLFMNFHTEFRDLLQKYQLPDLRLFVRPATQGTPFIEIAPMRPLDYLAVLSIWTTDTQTIPVLV